MIIRKCPKILNLWLDNIFTPLEMVYLAFALLTHGLLTGCTLLFLAIFSNGVRTFTALALS